MRVINWTVVLVVAAVALSSTSVSVGAAVDSSADSGAKLEEIIVTAQRREENAQTVPIAVTVLSQLTLEANNVNSYQELQYLVPSLSVNANAPGQCQFSLRGQGVSGNSGKPGVILYVNEIPVPDVNGIQSCGPGLLFDLENIQVL